MRNPEGEVGRVMHTIQERLQKAQIVRDTLVGPQSAEEELGAAMFGADTPIARSNEIIISPEQAQILSASAENIRSWVVAHAPPYQEEPSSRVDDEEGWAYNQGGFEISADDITKPSSLETPFLLSITETSSPYNPSASVWFSVVEGSKYNLIISFWGVSEKGERRIYQEYSSDSKLFTEMPGDDAIVIGDLLTRVSTHIGQKAG